jgi:hypothetical protein
MRPFLRHRAPQVLASALTLLVALAFGSAREWSDVRGRDSAIRVTRAAQRLDMADAASHSGEDPEIVAAPLSDFVTSSPTRGDGHGTPCSPAARPASAGPDAGVALVDATAHSRILARPGRSTFDRGPPLA